MKHINEKVNTINKILKLIERYNTALKDIVVVMDLQCEKVTLTSVPNLKCMKQYFFQKLFTIKHMRKSVGPKNK